MCEACQYPRCAGASCSAGNPISETPPAHGAFDENRNWFCQACRGLWCSVCEQKKDEIAFSARMRYHGNDDETRRCLDCSSPACTRSECTTCRNCRNPACTENLSCKRARFKLLAMCIPKTKTALESFLCGNCAVQCTTCGQRGGEHFSAWMREKQQAGKRHCFDCVNAGKKARN